MFASLTSSLSLNFFGFPAAMLKSRSSGLHIFPCSMNTTLLVVAALPGAFSDLAFLFALNAA